MKDRLNDFDFDIHYDFRDDCGGKDPDTGSPTLRRYHRMLWSKKLPNGEIMQLTHDNGGYLTWKGFSFASDAMINGLFYARAKNSVPELKRLLRDYDSFVEDFEHRTWTIGGEIIFPIHNNSMNQLRGTNPYINDRWDLTMECIRRFYLGEDSPLYKVLDIDRSFYELFVDFKGYVDFFHLQDCVAPDYSKVIFWQDDCSLTNTMPLPRTAGEHIVWTENSLQFIEKRAERMRHSLKSGLVYRNIESCFSESDLEYHSPEYTDDFFEILDEVVNLLKNDSELDVSTKGLRATRYANGYARYVKINGFGCGLLFDKENWKDPESVATPFWLNVNDSGWRLTEGIRLWFDSKDDHKIARKWQKQPCLALVPPVNESFHQVCESIKQEIVDAIKGIDELGKA
ncbi:MAG: hypothetical protein IKG72_04330 [Bacillus sp. (in: Bacteria)]|nr:hypothetical protein [Bacillus sp. (in: firmicutes)]